MARHRSLGGSRGRPARSRASSAHKAAAVSSGPWGRITGLLKALGPGLITGASDDDPSGIGTYAIAGASLGYATLWTALITFPMMGAVQFICARIAMVSGMGLAGVIRHHYSRNLLYPVVFSLAVANSLNVGVDIGAIAAALNLLVPIPSVFMIVPITLVIFVLLYLGSYRLISRIFKWLTLALLAYIGAAFLAEPDLRSVLLGTFVPTFSLDSAFLATLVALLGTTISPYLFFWQSSEEVEEELEQGRRRLRERKGASRVELREAFFDVGTGMFLSNLVMYFIILGTAATLFEAGNTDITSAAEAALALRPLAGDAAEELFAIGLIGSGFLAVPVLAGSAAYAICEAAGWRFGLDQKPSQAPKFYLVIAISMLAGMLINFIGLNPIQALFWMAVINGLLAPPMLVILLFVANDRSIMGNKVNGGVSNALGIATTLAMTLAAVALFLTWGS